MGQRSQDDWQDQLPGRKTLTKRIVKNIMKAKLKLGM